MTEDIKIDALMEVVNIGTGQAATALSQMLSQRVLINVPDIRLVPIEKVPAELGGHAQQVVGLYFQIDGDLGGRILIIFSKEGGHQMASILMGGEKIEEDRLSDMNRASLMEMGNIIANSYLNGLAGLLDMTLLPSVPYFAEDMLGAVVDFLLIEMARCGDHALLLSTEMKIETENIKGSFLVFPDEAFLKRIYQKLGIENL
ncbi:MAG: chemotaxis protein CheC [Endomicrobiales bacterium]